MDGLTDDDGAHLHSIQPKSALSLSKNSDANRTSYYSRIYDTVTMLPLTSLESLRGDVAGLRNVLNNREFDLEPVDQVIFVSGAKPREAIYYSVENHFDNLFRVGDCVDARGVPEAILAANRLAREL